MAGRHLMWRVRREPVATCRSWAGRVVPGAAFAVVDGAARACFRLPNRCRVSVYFCFFTPRFLGSILGSAGPR